ncbi:MAG: capsular polysaccharide biosynthesis protein [Pseudomonadota bacterium]
MSVRALTFSRGIARIPYLAQLLGVESVLAYRGARSPASGQLCVVGWGRKPNTCRARRYAAAHSLPYLSVEDGFLRSVGLGVRGDPPLSVVIDDLGIYYDATRPSRLELLLNGERVAALPVEPDPPLSAAGADPLQDAALLVRARACMSRLTACGLSKYNSSPDVTLPPSGRPQVLVVDQTAGDLSIIGGLASADSFAAMLNAALAEHPDAEILVKIHPDVIAGKKRGHLLAAATDARVRLLAEDCNPAQLVRQVRHVYTVTSLTGFEALLAGTPVTCFGAPFYAGWGLTDDRIGIPRRRQRRSLEQVFAAAYLLYARYRHPTTGVACGIEPVIEHLDLQRRLFRQNAGTLYCYGFTLWKRGYARRFLQCPWNRIRFVRGLRPLQRDVPADARIVVWGMRDPPGLAELARRSGIPVWRMEDGFLRSVGLGSDLTAPASLVLDRQGIYFDPTRPSELEGILDAGDFADDELAAARELRQKIVDLGLSKYNVGRGGPLAVGALPGQRVLLVPGQVETDASIRQGSVDIRTDAELLRAVRAAAADAWVIYKPHPDVVSGNRDGVAGSGDLGGYDQLVTDSGIVACLDAADEVHTMTSLTGFEALLRGKRVVTYGLPFYAGWGLTEDRHKLERRKRRLTLDELVAGCLMRYPRYLDLSSGHFTTAGTVLAELVQRRTGAQRQQAVLLPWHVRVATRLMNLINGIFYAR